MSNEFRHKSNSPNAQKCTKVNWEDIAIHEADSQAAGDVLYCNGTSWFRLPKGTDGDLLKSGATPSWQTVQDTPANGETTIPVSSNWAYDHVVDNTAHNALVWAIVFGG